MSSLNDESFYNILGEEISRNGLVQQMINFYGLLLDVGETKITDFNEGSEIRNLLESIAVDHYVMLDEQNELAKIDFIDTAEGEWLDKHGLNPTIGLERGTGVEATGEVTISIPAVQTSDVIIPEGTLVASTSAGLQFSTDYEVIISIGETSVDVKVTCLTVGEDGNVPAGSIDLIDDDFIDTSLLSITNHDAFEGGENYEEDEAYRQRLLAYRRRPDFGSKPYYISLAENVDGVHDAVLVNDEFYTAEVLVNGYSKPTPNDILVEVLANMSDISSIVLNHSFIVDKPVYTEYNLNVTVSVTSELPAGTIEDVLQSFVDGTVSNYDGRIEFTGANIGQSITKTDLIGALYTIGTVQDADIIITNSSDVVVDSCTVASNAVVKLNNIQVTQNIIGD